MTGRAVAPFLGASAVIETALPGDAATTRPTAYRQPTFDELGTPLAQTTFCVVDLETTGGSPVGGAGITEIGAVRVCGGVVTGEFQTLVNPGEPVPAFIAVLTGITNEMVAGSPRIAPVLAAFFEFARGCVLVAHNAPFDIGFLKAATGASQLSWPGFGVIDTVVLARRVLARDEVPNCKLSTLAPFFKATTMPEHRALADARATVDVMHGLFERLGPLGVHTLEELATYNARVSSVQRRKRHLAEKMPSEPGVYLFTDAAQRVLYIGTSGNLRRRVRSYFTGSETRSRMGEMVGLAQDVTGIACATRLEAQARELRLIAAHKPRYNRRSKFPEKMVWLKLTVEPFPRLSVVRSVTDDDASYLGPFGSRKTAEKVATAIHEATKIRQCTPKLSRHPGGTACALAQMDRCLAPCDGSITIEVYASEVDAVAAAMARDPRILVGTLMSRIRRLAGQDRFEEAGTHRDRMSAFVEAAARTQRLRAIAGCPQIVAARRLDEGGWEVHVIRHGRLAAAGRTLPGEPPMPLIDTLVDSAETVTPPVPPTPAGTVEEAELIIRWLDQPGVRLVEVEGEWSCPVTGAGSLRGWIERAYAGDELLSQSAGHQRRPPAR